MLCKTCFQLRQCHSHCCPVYSSRFSLASFWCIYYLLTFSLFSTFPSLYMISQVWGGRLNTGILVGRLVFWLMREDLFFVLFLLSMLYCSSFFFCHYTCLLSGVRSFIFLDEHRGKVWIGLQTWSWEIFLIRCP